MRELLLKNLVSKDKRCAELFLSEHFERGGLIHEIEKKTIYKVKAILEFTGVLDLELFVDQKTKENAPTQRFIIRKRDTRAGCDKLFYKVTGEQFIVLNDKVMVLKLSQYVKKTIINKAQVEKFTASNL